ncbi:MAG: glycosyl hydrolase [Candidatus Dojkabacteria bacterium]
MNQKLLYRIVFFLFIVSFAASVYFFYKANFEQQIPTVNPNPYNFVTENRTLDITKRIGLGVFEQNQESSNLSSVIDFENVVDRKMQYDLLFRAWGDNDNVFPTYLVPYFKQYKLEPVITWEPWKRDFKNGNILQPEYSLSSIVYGLHDGYIKSWAIATKEAQIPIIIRFAHEMVTPEGTKSWYPWQGEPDNYVAAYRRIVQIFRDNGATNVKFMWNPIVYDGSGSIDIYYPGDNYIDYIGLSVINLGTGFSKSGVKLTWTTCDEKFIPQYAAIANYTKPVILAEILSSDTGGSKALWYNECFPLFKTATKLVGMISVQVDDTYSISEVNADWRVNSTGSSLQAFKTGVKNGDFK